MHTVIVGNGIIGLSIAFRLLRRLSASDHITVIGKGSRPGSATLAAAAMLNSFAEVEAGSLESDIDLYRFELSHLASRMWPKFEAEIIKFGGDLPTGCAQCFGCNGGGCFDSGTYVINNTASDSLDDDNFSAIIEALQRFDEPFSYVAPNDIPNYAPSERHRAARAIYIPNEGWFNPRLMLEKLDMILARSPSVTLVDLEVVSLESKGGVVTHAKLSDGSIIEADNFVLATGATVSEVLQKSNLGIGVQRVFYGVGVSIEIKSADHPHKKCIRTPNRGLACGLYSVPYFLDSKQPLDHILIGATNFISPVPCQYPRLMSTESLMRGAMEQINTNFYRSEIVRVNVGWRPTTVDTYPILGRTSIANLLIASGTKRDGFHLAPVISESIVALLLGDKVDPRFAYFSPERKPIRNLSRAKAIDMAVRHQISALYQHGYSPAFGRMSQQTAQMLRDDLERLHDKVGAVEWGIHPEMLDMYRYGHAE